MRKSIPDPQPPLANGEGQLFAHFLQDSIGMPQMPDSLQPTFRYSFGFIKKFLPQNGSRAIFGGANQPSIPGPNFFMKHYVW